MYQLILHEQMGEGDNGSYLMYRSNEVRKIAIEVPVRKEILIYKEKLFFGFSLRQFISMTITLIITLIVGFLNHFTWQFSIDDLGIGLMIISSPILSFGWIKPNDLPMEKYLQIRWNYFKLDSYYTYPSIMEVSLDETMAKKETKRSKKYTEYNN